MERFRFLGIISDAVDSKTPWTANHSRRVEWLASTIGVFIDLSETERRRLSIAARVHDIGKVGINDNLLEMRMGITTEELERIKLHPVIGSDIINAFILDFLDSGLDIEDFHDDLREVLSVVRHHHERMDGKGYPDGLKGSSIPLFAKIVHVADAVDSMLVDRPYRRAPGIEHAVEELKKNRGTQFDTDIVDAFVKHFDFSLLLTLNDVLSQAYPDAIPPLKGSRY